jgi:hypothetical protein
METKISTLLEDDPFIIIHNYRKAENEETVEKPIKRPLK